jgi:hypothetical protein
MSNFKVLFLDDEKTRYIRYNQWGDRDKVTLQTTSGKLVTRTAQHWLCSGLPETVNRKIDEVYITYRGHSFYVTKSTILQD